MRLRDVVSQWILIFLSSVPIAGKRGPSYEGGHLMKEESVLKPLKPLNPRERTRARLQITIELASSILIFDTDGLKVSVL